MAYGFSLCEHELRLLAVRGRSESTASFQNRGHYEPSTLQILAPTLKDPHDKMEFQAGAFKCIQPGTVVSDL